MLHERTKISYVNNNNNNHNQNRRRKRSPVANVNHNDQKQSLDHTTAKVNLVMGQVKILKRGEKLSLEKFNVVEEDQKVKTTGLDMDLNRPDLLLGFTDRFRLDSITMQKQIRVSDYVLKDGIYAGSAFVASPPLSSVSVPGFLGKNDVAISDLRRLLRLDLD
ncbi:hypothetical protein P8452_13614 [Trifolium repens]|nr:hypothetical protein P8452_13614 [Trifolium repens]